MLRTATISIFLSVAKCGSICRAQTCKHSGIEPSRSAKAFLQGEPKCSKKFQIFPLSNCRMCIDPSLTGFYRVSQKVSDVIPVLRLIPIATQRSAVFVFLSVAKCGRICRAQTCAHSGIEPSTLAKGFLQVGPKVRKNFEFLTISSLYMPYIWATTKNRGLQAAYVAFWPSL